MQAEIAERLRPVCPGWPDDLFTALVQQIAAITVKYDHKGGMSEIVYDDRIAQKLVAEMKDLLSRNDEVRKELL